IIGATLYFNSNVTVEREIITKEVNKSLHPGEIVARGSNVVTKNIEGESRRFVEVKTPITTIPFTKNHEFNYSKLISWMGNRAEAYTW
ncbi:MAG: phospho-N-acetylmuramoyl-pentapeptide-transferase, partial [Hydrotalea flava]|nr:phospho-N-acetylmuramoyl-pentapeptide-transferase [Hydrotalea flava]NIM37123.1 phospho-N-acetylmuramoyl-pentapeptide-transferase [Hydrotalea flava]NIN02316.1 phospho-N-acetylmuramoyl-pentapeptide-transferase [Hydrotalea flava]NIN13968.1 phospho-N-acetylmuramoyl-pentapeptide-transferase [Hydrotalea flava]NIO93049.1 phospho-N-acetylmuramoyl-pentapeptide-transferase [Hydrotalea flava]